MCDFRIVLLMVYTTICVVLGSVDDESTLQRILLTNYTRNVRPNETVQIRMSLSVTNIIEMDIVDQRMLLSGSLVLFWFDSRLQWDPVQYNGIETVYFKADEIWRPLLVLLNSADDIYALGDKSNERSIPIQVESSGFVVWLAPVFFNSLCSADVALFPFDTQKCELAISSWMYPNDKVNMSIIPGFEVNLQNYEENGEYKLARVYSEMRKYLNNYIDDPWSIVVFGVELQRRYSYYVINIVLPVLFLEALGVVVFLVPATSGEKLAYALTLLLSLIVMTTIVAEKIPTTSIHVPVLSIYVLEGVALAVAEVLVTVYILQLHRWHGEQRELGKRHTFLMSLLTKFSCGTKNKVDVVNDGDIESQVTGVETVSTDVAATDKPDKQSVPVSAWKTEVTMNYQDVAVSIEKFCCWLFTLLMIFFCLQALFTVVCS